METKPFNLQSPEQIAKDYGGNKQKIAQAASMGMVDPTAAVLAGMFIDRMRSAQMLEQQPQGTVAQQVFQPQQAPQGAPPMGAPPMGAPPMGAPPMGAPPMGAPPMGAPPMGAPPMGAPPPPQPPGMAMGGLMDLSVPDDMFSEPVTDAENFAGGGLVAFAMGGEADEDDEDELTLGDRLRAQFRGPEDPTYYGRPMTAADMRGAFGIPEPMEIRPELPTLGDRLREQFRGPEDPTYYGRPMTAADMRGAFGIPEPKKSKPPAFKSGDQAAGERTARPSTSQRALPSAPRREYKPELPTLGDRLRAQFRGPEDPTYYGRPMTAADMRKTFGIPEPKKEGPPPFRQQDSRSRSMLTGGPPARPSEAASTRALPSAPRPAAPRPAAPRPGTGVAPSPRVAMAPPSAPRGLGAIATPQGAPRAPVPGAPTAPGAPSAPQAPAGPTGMQGGIEEFMRLQKQYGGDAATPYRDRLAAAAEAQLDPKAMAAQKKQDMWQAVAQFGFNMAATNSPYFMQAAGQAGAATVPFMAASRKERKAMERDALKQLADVEGITAAEKKQALQSGVAYAQNLADDQRQESQFQQTLGLTREKFEYDKRRDAQDRAERARGSGGGGFGAPEFPGGMDGYRLERFYKAEMAKVPQLLAKNPRIKAEYDANPQAWMARYSADAERRALLSLEAGEKGAGRERRGSPAPSGGPSSRLANMPNEEFIAEAKRAGVL